MAYFVTIDIKNLLASSEEEDEEGGGDAVEAQPLDGIEGDEESIAEDFLETVQRLEENQTGSCSEGELINPDTGECEEFHVQEDVIVNEVCDNQVDDDLDGKVDLEDVDCIPVFANATNYTSKEQMTSLSTPSSLPISPGLDDLDSSEGEEEEEGGAEGAENDSIAEDFLEGVPSSLEVTDFS